MMVYEDHPHMAPHALSATAFAAVVESQGNQSWRRAQSATKRWSSYVQPHTGPDEGRRSVLLGKHVEWNVERHGVEKPKRTQDREVNGAHAQSKKG